jgi:hypothetical protein
MWSFRTLQSQTLSFGKNVERPQNKENLFIAILILSAKNSRLGSLLPVGKEAPDVLEKITKGEIVTTEN